MANDAGLGRRDFASELTQKFGAEGQFWLFIFLMTFMAFMAFFCGMTLIFVSIRAILAVLRFVMVFFVLFVVVLLMIFIMVIMERAWFMLCFFQGVLLTCMGF